MWRTIGIASFAWLGEAAAAFLTFDLFLRFMSVDPDRLRIILSRSAWLYFAIAFLMSAAGAWIAWVLACEAGLAGVVINWLPWWLLWRFGLRKQFTYLFKVDGGRPLDTEKPDPR